MATSVIPIQLSEAEQKLLQAFIYEECGMFFDERRIHFLQDRLQRRLKATGLDTFYSYYRLLQSKEGKSELTTLLENLTINETSFFRNKPQLDLFHKVILEELLLDAMYTLPSQKRIKEFVITSEMVERRRAIPGEGLTGVDGAAA